jgi:hypothetical protein
LVVSSSHSWLRCYVPWPGTTASVTPRTSEFAHVYIYDHADGSGTPRGQCLPVWAARGPRQHYRLPFDRIEGLLVEAEVPYFDLSSDSVV